MMTQLPVLVSQAVGLYEQPIDIENEFHVPPRLLFDDIRYALEAFFWGKVHAGIDFNPFNPVVAVVEYTAHRQLWMFTRRCTNMFNPDAWVRVEDPT